MHAECRAQKCTHKNPAKYNILLLLTNWEYYRKHDRRRTFPQTSKTAQHIQKRPTSDKAKIELSFFSSIQCVVERKIQTITTTKQKHKNRTSLPSRRQLTMASKNTSNQQQQQQQQPEFRQLHYEQDAAEENDELLADEDAETRKRREREKEQQEEAFFSDLNFDMLCPPIINEESTPPAPATRWNVPRHGPPSLKRWGHAALVLSSAKDNNKDTSSSIEDNHHQHHTILVLGGCSSDSITDSVLAWSPYYKSSSILSTLSSFPRQQPQQSPAANHWQERPALNEKRWGHAAVRCNNFVYAIGGIGRRIRQVIIADGESRGPQILLRRRPAFSLDEEEEYCDYVPASLDTIERAPLSILLEHPHPSSHHCVNPFDDYYSCSSCLPTAPAGARPSRPQLQQHRSPWSTLNCRLGVTPCNSQTTTTSTYISLTTSTTRQAEQRKGCVAAVAVRDRYIVILTGGHHVEILDTHTLTLRPGPSLNVSRWWCGVALLDAGPSCCAELFVVGGIGCATVESLQFCAPQGHPDDHADKEGYNEEEAQDDDVVEDKKTDDPLRNTSSSSASSSCGHDVLQCFDSCWKMRPDLTLTCGERSHHAVTTTGGLPRSLVVVVGGQDKAFQRYNSVEVLDPQRRKVWRLPDMWVGTEGCSVVTLPFDMSVSSIRAPMTTPFSCFDHLLIMGGHNGHTALDSVLSLPIIDLSFSGLMRRIRHIQKSQQYLLLLRLLVPNIHDSLQNAYNGNVQKLIGIQRLWHSLLFYHLSRRLKRKKEPFGGSCGKQNRFSAPSIVSSHSPRHSRGRTALVESGHHSIIIDLLDSLPSTIVELTRWKFMTPVIFSPQQKLFSSIRTSSWLTSVPEVQCLEIVGILTKEIANLTKEIAKVQQAKWLRMVFAKMNQQHDRDKLSIQILSGSLSASVAQWKRLQNARSTLIFAHIACNQDAAAQLCQRYFGRNAPSSPGEISPGTGSDSTPRTTESVTQQPQAMYSGFAEDGWQSSDMQEKLLPLFAERRIWALTARILEFEETLQRLLLRVVYDTMKRTDGDNDPTVASNTMQKERYNRHVAQLQRLKKLQHTLVFSHLSSGRKAVEFVLNCHQQKRATHTVANQDNLRRPVHRFTSINHDRGCERKRRKFVQQNDSACGSHIKDLVLVDEAPAWALKTRIHQMEHLQYELLLELVLSQMNGGTSGTLMMRCNNLAASCSQLRRLLNTFLFSYLIKESNNIGRVPATGALSPLLLHRVHGPVPCPRLFVLAKPSWIGPLHKKRRFFANRRVSYVLYFLCARDLTIVEPGILLKTNTTWLETVAPALAISLYLMRLSVACNFGVSVNFEEWLAQRCGMEPVIDEPALASLFSSPSPSNVPRPSRFLRSCKFDVPQCHALPHGLYGYVESLQQRLRHLLYQLDDNSSSIQTHLVDWTTVEHEAFCVCPESYDAIARVAEEYPQWRNEMNFSCSQAKDYKDTDPDHSCSSCISHGGGVWVKKRNTREWEKGAQEP